MHTFLLQEMTMLLSLAKVKALVLEEDGEKFSILPPELQNYRINRITKLQNIN